MNFPGLKINFKVHLCDSTMENCSIDSCGQNARKRRSGSSNGSVVSSPRISVKKPFRPDRG